MPSARVITTVAASAGVFRHVRAATRRLFKELMATLGCGSRFRVPGSGFLVGSGFGVRSSEFGVQAVNPDSAQTNSEHEPRTGNEEERTPLDVRWFSFGRYTRRAA